MSYQFMDIPIYLIKIVSLPRCCLFFFIPHKHIFTFHDLSISQTDTSAKDSEFSVEIREAGKNSVFISVPAHNITFYHLCQYWINCFYRIVKKKTRMKLEITSLLKLHPFSMYTAEYSLSRIDYTFYTRPVAGRQLRPPPPYLAHGQTFLPSENCQIRAIIDFKVIFYGGRV